MSSSRLPNLVIYNCERPGQKPAITKELKAESTVKTELLIFPFPRKIDELIYTRRLSSPCFPHAPKKSVHKGCDSNRLDVA